MFKMVYGASNLEGENLRREVLRPNERTDTN